ncbi:hypothetical protein ACA910_017127 [Epithemia clementina (nom. ined.)]
MSVEVVHFIADDNEGGYWEVLRQQLLDSPTMFLGCRVQQYFTGMLYNGTIVGYNARYQWWNVVYDDDDEEDNNIYEIIAMLKRYRKNGGETVDLTNDEIVDLTLDD